MKERIPVTIISGFLGSGKTTLVNHILNQQSGRKLAIIQNEFGEIGIDGELIENREQGIFELNNGCICCSVQSDLVRALEHLKLSERSVDYALIETTGLADPRPVAQTFMQNPLVKAGYKLDGIISIADAKHLLSDLEEHREAKHQIRSANIVLLNKADLVGQEKLDHVKQRIQEVNPIIDAIYPTRYSQILLEKILDIKAFDLAKLDFGGPKDNDDDHHHYHSEGITSLSLEYPGCVDLDQLYAWLSRTLHLEQNKIFRVKGMANIKGQERRFVFQVVHNIINGEFGTPWNSRERTNRFVFIGKGLNKKLLRDGFRACLEANR